MSAKTKKNIRKIILLNTNQNNNISRQLKINNKFPKIAFSNDLLSYANKDNKGIKYRSQTDPDIAINKSKLNLKNNISNIIKVDSITNTTININNISPKKKQDETSNSIKKDKNKSEQKITLKPLKTENNSISLSNVYKLPMILKNDSKTIKFNLLQKKPKLNRVSNNNNILLQKQKTLNPNINLFSNQKSQEIKEMKERLSSQGLTGINNNVDINIID